MATDRTEIRLMVEYAATLPLWVPMRSGGYGCLSSAAGLGLSKKLVADLTAWQTYFTAHFSVTDWVGWRPPEAAAEFARRGHKLRDRLAAELPATAIILDLWPVDLSPPTV